MQVNLSTQVELKCGDKNFTFEGRPITGLKLEMNPWGYSGQFTLSLAREHTPGSFSSFLGTDSDSDPVGQAHVCHRGEGGPRASFRC